MLGSTFETIFGKYTRWLRQDDRMTDDQALEFHELASESNKKQIRSMMLQKSGFQEAMKTLSGLSARDSIEVLYTRAVQVALAPLSTSDSSSTSSWMAIRPRN